MNRHLTHTLGCCSFYEELHSEYGDGAGNTTEDNCLECFDTVGWAAGRASGP